MVRFGGRFLEVRGELTGRKVELRFDPQQREPLPKVFVDGKLVCALQALQDPVTRMRFLNQPENREVARFYAGKLHIGTIVGISLTCFSNYWYNSRASMCRYDWNNIGITSFLMEPPPC